MLEFLGLPGTGELLEANLEKALLDNLQGFLLELGKGFAFVARQYRISTESKDFFIDMVFYNYLLKCFVLFDLKTDPVKAENLKLRSLLMLALTRHIKAKALTQAQAQAAKVSV